jgi:hypothetical protein
MAKKKIPSKPALAALSMERATRLFRLLNLLGKGPRTRVVLTRKLHLGIRGFYRDLEVLRAVGILVELSNSRYHLTDELDSAIERLPFPDPGLNLGEARQLAKGRTRAHKKIRAQIEKIEK